MKREAAVPTRARAAFEQLTHPGEHLLLACSGGGDSVALVVLADEARSACGLRLSVACVDHGLRAESAGELDAVEELCTARGLEFVGVRLTLADGPDLQRRARDARYAALLREAGSRGARLVTGHTRDDQAETVLSRVLRGGRVDALRGIAPVRADGVLRPLLGIGRKELRAFLRHRGVSWCEDPSNADERFERVRMRALLATIAELEPRAAEHLAQLATDARRATRMRRAHGRRFLARVESAGRLRHRALRALAEGTRREVLRQWLGGGSDAVLDALERLVRDARGEVRVAGARRVVLQDGWLVTLEGAAPTES